MTSNRYQKAQGWVLDMLENAETAAALDGYSAEDAFEIGAEAKRFAEILRIAIAQPAAGEPQPIGYANPKHLASMAAGTRAIVPVLPSICPGVGHTEPVYGAPPAAAHGDDFQARVQPWMRECFGEAIAGDRGERNHRFLEEALELVQSAGCTASEAHQLVDYVFGRPVGEPAQEVGGVMVTLAALCLASSLDMHDAAEVELARIWTKVEAIRAKQAAKPKHSPLPIAAAHGGEADTKRLDWLASTVAVDYRGTLPDGDYRSFREAIDAAMRAQGEGEVL